MEGKIAPLRAFDPAPISDLNFEFRMLDFLTFFMLLGAHVSVAGGLYKAFNWTAKYDCECLQIFSKSQFKWTAKPLQPEDIRLWKEAWRESGSLPCLIHDAYLINLSTPDKELRRKSVDALVDEIERAHALGIPFVNTHPGSHRGAGEVEGLRNCVQSLAEALDRTSHSKTAILLETTAGQGHDLGARFEQIAAILEQTPNNKRLGVCVDTCHIFSAGYDLVSDKGYAKVWSEFDRLIGIKHLRGFHLNDSKFPLGSHRDRHAEIGKGLIGEAAFRRLVRDARFKSIPGVTELPEETTLPSLKTLRRLRDA